MKILAAMLLCLLPGFALADTLHRCVGPRGQVSYQAAACASGHRLDRRIDFVPDPTPAPEAHAPRSTPKTSRRAYSGGTRSRTKPKPSPCAQAKAKRTRQLEQLGLKRTFDQLSRIDQAVRDVCNGY